MKFLPHQAYKLSDADWVGEIPQHWVTRRAKYLFREISKPSRDGSERLLSVSEYYGVAPRDEKVEEGEHLTRASSLEGYKKCQRGDLVMNIMLAWKRGLGTTDYDGIVSPSYSVFRLTTKHGHPHFFGYLLRTNEYVDEFWRRSSGVIDSRLRLYPEVFGRIPILVPPTHEQHQIAAFLDYETARIDRLIEKQQRLIELLREKRQAVISHGVTKGLNPDVPMKDSGVEWLGEIPAHWDALPLKRLSLVLDCKHKTPEYVEFGYPLVSTTEVKPGTLNLSLVTRHVSQDAYKDMTEGRHPEHGDIIYSRNASLGAAAFVKTDQPFCMGQDVVLIKANRMDGEFLTYTLNSLPIAHQVDAASVGATFKRINVQDIKRFWISTPPHEEQRYIVRHLHLLTGRYSKVVEKVRTIIQLLNEHRTALISAAVTGKIDVRDWQPPSSANEAEERDDQLLQAAEERAHYSA